MLTRGLSRRDSVPKVLGVPARKKGSRGSWQLIVVTTKAGKGTTTRGSQGQLPLAAFGPKGNRVSKCELIQLRTHSPLWPVRTAQGCGSEAPLMPGSLPDAEKGPNQTEVGKTERETVRQKESRKKP